MTIKPGKRIKNIKRVNSHFMTSLKRCRSKPDAMDATAKLEQFLSVKILCFSHTVTSGGCLRYFNLQTRTSVLRQH